MKRAWSSCAAARTITPGPKRLRTASPSSRSARSSAAETRCATTGTSRTTWAEAARRIASSRPCSFCVARSWRRASVSSCLERLDPVDEGIGRGLEAFRRLVDQVAALVQPGPGAHAGQRLDTAGRRADAGLLGRHVDANLAGRPHVRPAAELLARPHRHDADQIAVLLAEQRLGPGRDRLAIRQDLGASPGRCSAPSR